MPRRIPDYALQFADFNMIASIGAFAFGLSQVIFVVVLIDNVFLKRGNKATKHVWDMTRGLEWTVDSPAPHHTFDVPPQVTKDLDSYDT